MVRTLAGLVLACSGVLGIDAPAKAAGGFSLGYSGGHGISFHWSSGTSHCSPYSRHRHVFHASADRVWVPAAYRPVLVGYDRCGNPLHEQVLVTPGYWKTVVVHRCSCGARY